MKAKSRPKVNRAVAAKAKQVLAFAEAKAKEVADWLELHFAIFGVGGKATELFPTEAERAAFLKTPEHKRLLALMDRLPTPRVKEVVDFTASANGAISVRLPRSVHAALLAEAK